VNTHSALSNLQERERQSASGSRLVSLAAAIIAVLAALGTLFAHHRSISALTAKNQAILEQARASDAYNAYEAKNIRLQLAQAFLSAHIPSDPNARKSLQAIADQEKASSAAALEKAQELAEQSDIHDTRSESVLHSYETLEIATTFFEIAIILVSISALARTAIFLSLGSGLSAVGLVLLIVGFFQGQ
jgi:Domain of unknown function (DUF4337)